MNIPNTLTIFRIVLTFAFIFFLFIGGFSGKVLAVMIFALASFTDFLDGYLAKKTNQITDFGRLMDPIADKVLVISAFCAFVEMGVIPAWMVIVIIAREFCVTALRVFALSKGKVISADRGGKHKTVWQVASISLILLFILFRDGNFIFWTKRCEDVCKDVILISMSVTVVLTLVTGISYLIRNKEVYLNA